MKKIIFNADVGEEAGNDTIIMPYLSWCNIACGSHAGNEKTIQKTIDLAIQYNVKIGAHPSFPDRQNFGREVMDIGYGELVKSITDQIKLIKFYSEKRGQLLHHVKPHGALYNEAIANEKMANAIVDAVKSIDKNFKIITTKESLITKLFSDNFDIKHEVFADRRYNNDYTLVSRNKKNAVIQNPQKVYEHVYGMIHENKIVSEDGSQLKVDFDTICIHGDHPNAVAILKRLESNNLIKVGGDKNEQS